MSRNTALSRSLALIWILTGPLPNVDAAEINGTYIIQTVQTNRVIRVQPQFPFQLKSATRGENWLDDPANQFVISPIPGGGGHYVFSKSTQQYIFLDATDRILKSGAQVDDGSMRFTLEGPADSLRLRVQANQFVWHEDGTNDQLISTRFGVEDNFTVFKLIPVSGTPNPGGGGQGSGLRPIGASSSNPHPSMAAFVNPDQSLDVAWRSTDGKIFVSTYSAPDYRLVRQIAVENSLGLFGGYTKDENGIGYLLTARPEQLGVNGDDGMQRNAWLRRPNVLHLLRIPPGGGSQFFVDLNQESIYQSWGIYNPMQTGANITSRLAYGSGSVVASFAHNIPGGGHMHTTGTLIGVSPTGTSTYAKGAGNHSMSNQVWFDGINFVQIQEGEQGILMSRLIPAGNGQWSWSGDKLVYRHASAEPLADPSAPDPISDLEEFVRFGSVQNAGPNYMILFSRKQGQGFVYGLKDQEWLGQVSGAGLCITLVPRANFEALPTFQWPQNPVGPGIVTREIRTPQGTNNYVRPRLVDMNDGTYVAVFEEWATNQQYLQTLAMRIDANGQTLAGPIVLNGNPRIQRAADSFRIGGQAGWIAGDGQNRRMMLHTLDASLNLRSYPLSLQ